jgi:hypothetical protein
VDIYNEPGKDRAVEFPVFLSATVGRDLRLVGTKYEYALVAGGGRAGTISLLGEFWLAHMACREGDWFLTRRRKHGWEFVIQAEDGSQVGLYCGRRWRAGGTILMADGTRVDLRRRTPMADWNLQTPDERPFAAISISGLERDIARVTILSLPSGVADVHIALLTACSVVSLGGMAPGAGPVGGFAVA